MENPGWNESYIYERLFSHISIAVEHSANKQELAAALALASETSPFGSACVDCKSSCYAVADDDGYPTPTSFASMNATLR